MGGISTFIPARVKPAQKSTGKRSSRLKKRKQVSPSTAFTLQHPHPCWLLLELEVFSVREGLEHPAPFAACLHLFFLPSLHQPSLSPPCLFHRCHQPLGLASPGASTVLEALRYQLRALALSLCYLDLQMFLGGFWRPDSIMVWPSEGNCPWHPWALACQLVS